MTRRIPLDHYAPGRCSIGAYRLAYRMGRITVGGRRLAKGLLDDVSMATKASLTLQGDSAVIRQMGLARRHRQFWAMLARHLRASSRRVAPSNRVSGQSMHFQHHDGMQQDGALKLIA